MTATEATKIADRVAIRTPHRDERVRAFLSYIDARVADAANAGRRSVRATIPAGIWGCRPLVEAVVESLKERGFFADASWGAFDITVSWK